MTKYCKCGHQKAEHFPVNKVNNGIYEGKVQPKEYCCHSYILFGCSCNNYKELKNTKTVWRTKKNSQGYFYSYRILVNKITNRIIYTDNNVNEDRNNFG